LERERSKEVKNMLVSVIVPVYNAEEFLKRCIDSVINQRYRNIELILVNDGSTDNSRMICDSYTRADKRIKVISQKNRGPAAARNTGIRHATGDFAFFLDADDFIEKNTLEILVSGYNQYRPDLIMGNFSKLENDGRIIRQKVSFAPDDVPFTHKTKMLSKSDIVSYLRHFLRHPSNHLISYCWGRLYKLSIIKQNGIFANEDMRLFEDFVFNLDYLEHANEVVFANEVLYTYTMHNNHVSASMTIVDGDSLLHDMGVFKAKAGEFLKRADAGSMDTIDIQKEVGHLLIHYAIVFLVRSCRQIAGHNRERIYSEIRKIVSAPIFSDSLRHYSPLKGNSRIFPVLARLKLIDPLMFYCKRKAYKRYGRPRSD